MSARPAPKRSSFGSSHPIEHGQGDVEADSGGTAAQDQSEVAAAAPSPSLSPSPGTAEDKGRRKPGPAASGKVKKKAAVWADEEVIDRIRGAWFHTPTTSGERESSFSEFLLQAALARTVEREREYNGGSPFPPASSGTIGVGRKS